MATNSSLQEKRNHNPVREGLAQTGLYHSFRLPSGQLLQGAMPIEWQEHRLASFQLPETMAGLRALDIGPWDGYFTFELERRGASVTAIDYVDLDTFRALHRAFQSRVDYRRMDVYELDPATIGTFDIVLCLGVLYHLKHPLLAMEKICAVTTGTCIFDTFVIDGEPRLQGINPAVPYAEFYEYTELAGQTDNWCGPTVSAVESWIRAAGFAQAEVLCVTDTSARLAAHRHWRNLPPDELPPLELAALAGHQYRGRSFYTAKESYIELWSAWPHAETPSIQQCYPEIDGFGVAPLACAVSDGALMVSFRIPPGLAPGRHSARLKVDRSGWSEPRDFFVDLPAPDESVAIASVQDGVAWTSSRLDWANGGWLTVWATGLSPEADPSNTQVLISGVPHVPEAVFPEGNQINLKLRPVIHAGNHTVAVSHRGRVSDTFPLQITGTPPPIHGLEALNL